MNASCERVKYAASLDTYFLGNRTEEFESKTYEMADALAKLHKEAYQSAHDAESVILF